MPELALSLPLHVDPLPYQDRLEARDPASIDLVVIHCTELPDLAMARRFGEEVRYASGTGNSGHYYIDRDGSLHQYVDPAFIAHHVRGYNARAIGIELVNTGRYPHWLARDAQHMDEPYSDVQIYALIALLNALAARYPALRLIEGHEDLDTATEAASDDPAVQVRRKLDPGPLFPWPRVLQAVALRRGVLSTP